MTLRTFSYGGGVQSTAALVLAAQGKIDYSIFLFCNVGDDSEHPATLAYVRDVAMPYAAAQGIVMHEIFYTKRDGTQPSIYQEVMRSDNKSTDIPMRLGTGNGRGMPLKRICTNDFKISVADKWVKRHGATAAEPAIMGLGISLDEFQRMSTDDPKRPHIKKSYPLIDLRLTRQDCINIIERAGLPVPPKSSCYFCPFHTHRAWQELLDNEPELFKRVVEMERHTNRKRAALGMGPVYMHRKLLPLDEALRLRQHDLIEDIEDACESGYCLT